MASERLGSTLLSGTCNRSGLTSAENLFVVLLAMAPSSQQLEPPANPGRFTSGADLVDIAKSLGRTESVTQARVYGLRRSLRRFVVGRRSLSRWV
jgi:hypothetical protein